MRDDRRLVYSTDGSLPLPEIARVRKPAPPKKSAPPDDGVVRVGFERRRGGGVTTIHGLPAALQTNVAGDLKRRCGTGGTIKGDVVELQGDHRDAAIAHLASLGRRAKRTGG